MSLVIRELFYYDETSETCLRWKTDRRPKRAPNGSSRIKAGDVAGTFNTCYKTGKPKGSYVRVLKKAYHIHRIVWGLFNEEIPEGMVIDHINGNPWDNRIENLACKTRKQNNQNRCISSNNKSGVPGVARRSIIRKSGLVSDYYISAVDIDGKSKTKCFNISIFGEERAFQMACEWRFTKLTELNDQGGMYTERHKTGGMKCEGSEK